MSSERPENNKNENPCFKIYSFLRSEDAKKFKIDSVDRALLHAIVGYIGMSNERACKARRDAIMNDAGIKNKTCYVKHLRKLQDLRLIKTIRKWKMNLHYMGDYFIHYEENKSKNSGALNVPDNSPVNIKDAKRTSSGTLNVPYQVRQTYSTIDIEMKENENKEGEEIHSRSKIELTTVEKQKSEEIEPHLFDEIKLNNVCGEVLTNSKTNSIDYLTCYPPGLVEFLETYPKKTRHEECRKLWEDNHLEVIQVHINQDLKNRIQNHAPWLRNFKAGTVQYIPNPYDHLLHERWHEPITPLTESEITKFKTQSRSTHDNKNRPCIKKRQNSFFCRSQERTKQEQEPTREKTEISVG